MLSFSVIATLAIGVCAGKGEVHVDRLHTCPVLSPMHLRDSAICLEHELAIDSNGSAAENIVQEESPWVQGNKCHRLDADEFCAYTNQKFKAGQGISIITNAERLAKVVSRPIFSYGQNSLHSVLHQPPYKDAEIPGKGIGLVATRHIKARQRIMDHSPAVMVDGKAMEGLKQDHIAEILGTAIENLPSAHRARFLNLSTHASVASHAEKVHKIFSINRFRTGIGEGGWEFHSAFTEVSRLNHDCRPNCVYYFDPDTLSQKVIAVTDIMPGEELTISYIDGFQPSSTRQETLHKHWGFQCSCQRCSEEKHIVAESDLRIAQILQLWKELDDYSGSSPATPEKAELLVLLYEQEGMHGRMQEAYYRAALEWNGVGQAAQATKHAKLCLDRGLAFKGPGKPFLEKMKDLVKDPEAHSSWKFRVGKETSD